MLLVISATTFLIFFASPIDPASLTCGKSCTPAVIEGNRIKMGYDKPVARAVAQVHPGPLRRG